MSDYDATLGRYIQADPLGPVDGASVYGHVGGNPAMLSDPTGQCPWCVAVVAGAIFGVATGYVLEETIGDGCYTWADAGRDAAIGAAFGPLGKAIGLADDAARAAAGVAASRAGAASGDKIIGIATRTTRDGERAVKVTRANGRVTDISPRRVKEEVRITHPKAPEGQNALVKWPNPIPGTKGKKRPPTPEELEFLKGFE
jgi:hypothetical protein